MTLNIENRKYSCYYYNFCSVHLYWALKARALLTRVIKHTKYKKKTFVMKNRLKCRSVSLDLVKRVKIFSTTIFCKGFLFIIIDVVRQ